MNSATASVVRYTFDISNGGADLTSGVYDTLLKSETTQILAIKGTFSGTGSEVLVKRDIFTTSDDTVNFNSLLNSQQIGLAAITSGVVLTDSLGGNDNITLPSLATINAMPTLRALTLSAFHTGAGDSTVTGSDGTYLIDGVDSGFASTSANRHETGHKTIVNGTGTMTVVFPGQRPAYEIDYSLSKLLSKQKILAVVVSADKANSDSLNGVDSVVFAGEPAINGRPATLDQYNVVRLQELAGMKFAFDSFSKTMKAITAIPGTKDFAPFASYIDGLNNAVYKAIQASQQKNVYRALFVDSIVQLVENERLLIAPILAAGNAAGMPKAVNDYVNKSLDKLHAVFQEEGGKLYDDIQSGEASKGLEHAAAVLLSDINAKVVAGLSNIWDTAKQTIESENPGLDSMHPDNVAPVIPAPSPIPIPPDSVIRLSLLPTPSANPSVAAFVAANMPVGTFDSVGMALASAGLGALAGASGTVTANATPGGPFAASQAGVVSVAVATAPATGSTVALPSGYGALLAQGSNAMTLSDAGAAGAVLMGNAGPTTFNSTGSGVSLVGGPGQNRFNVLGTATITSGNGASTVVGSGQAGMSVFTGTGGSTVVLAGGASSVQSNGQDTVFGGAGTSTITAGKGLVAVGGDGRMSFIGGSATSLVFGAKGGVDYTAGSAYDIAVGGSGTLVAQGGVGGGQFWGNSGSDVLRAGTGATTVLVANNGGQLFSAGGAGNFLVAGAGDAVLDGSQATGNDAFFGGTGRDTIMAGSGNDLIGTGTGTSTVQLGSGKDTVFAFGTSTVTAGSGSADVVMGGTVALNIAPAAGSAARSFALFNFVPGTDRINLSGYSASTIADAVANQVNGSGQTVMTLGDKTQLQLIGVARADASYFS